MVVHYLYVAWVVALPAGFSLGFLLPFFSFPPAPCLPLSLLYCWDSLIATTTPRCYAAYNAADAGWCDACTLIFTACVALSSKRQCLCSLTLLSLAAMLAGCVTVWQWKYDCSTWHQRSAVTEWNGSWPVIPIPALLHLSSSILCSLCLDHQAKDLHASCNWAYIRLLACLLGHG